MIAQLPPFLQAPDGHILPLKGGDRMKQLLRDAAAMLLVTLLALALDRAGAFAALAEKLERPAPTPAAVYAAESAAYLPPAAAPETPPTAAPAVEAPLPRVRFGGSASADIRALLEEGWSYALSGGGPQILILHSHACESFAPGLDRSTDRLKTVVAIGDVLAEALEANGFSVLHDRTLYDDPVYAGAYDRSGEAVRAALEANPSLRVVIDLHRDSLGGERTEYAAPDGSESAQVMLLLTTGENGLYHPTWKENLKLGLEIQSELDRQYPGFARELYLSPARYNQHLCPGSLLAEVGTEANTLEEAKRAALLLADGLSAVLARHLES